MLVWGTKGCVYGSEDEFESHDAQEICAHFFLWGMVEKCVMIGWLMQGSFYT